MEIRYTTTCNVCKLNHRTWVYWWRLFSTILDYVVYRYSRPDQIFPNSYMIKCIDFQIHMYVKIFLAIHLSADSNSSNWATASATSKSIKDSIAGQSLHIRLHRRPFPRCRSYLPFNRLKRNVCSALSPGVSPAAVTV